MRWDFICVIDDKNVVWSYAHHPGHAVLCQKSTQVVISYPAVLSSTFGEMVEEHVQDFVTYIIICTVEEELQETVETTKSIRWSVSKKLQPYFHRVVWYGLVRYGAVRNGMPWSAFP